MAIEKDDVINALHVLKAMLKHAGLSTGHIAQLMIDELQDEKLIFAIQHITAPTAQSDSTVVKQSKPIIKDNTAKYLAKITEKSGNAYEWNYDAQVLHEASAISVVYEMAAELAAYKNAYYALNQPANDLQKRLDIANELKQYE